MKLSRSKIDLFIECPCCFYKDIKRGIKRPPGYPFSLNSAVDALLKKEFDLHRFNGTQHPLQTKFNIDGIPANHPHINEWRDSLHHGVAWFHPVHHCKLYGGIDDLWINSQGEYHVVDYKATAKSKPVTSLPEWADGYRRQMEIYQWLLRKNNLKVSNTAYFVYCTGDTNKTGFSEKLEFNCHIIPYEGNDSWVDGTIDQIFEILRQDKAPASSEKCEYCKFVRMNIQS
jgi:hypothetical protein